MAGDDGDRDDGPEVARGPAPTPRPKRADEPVAFGSFRPFDAAAEAAVHQPVVAPRAPYEPGRGPLFAFVFALVILVIALAGSAAVLIHRHDVDSRTEAAPRRRTHLTDPSTGIRWTMDGTPVSGAREVAGPAGGPIALTSWELDRGDGTVENVRIYDAGGKALTFESRIRLLVRNLGGKLVSLEGARLAGGPAAQARIVAHEGGERLTFDLVVGDVEGAPVLAGIQRLGPAQGHQAADAKLLDRLVRSVRAPATP